MVFWEWKVSDCFKRKINGMCWQSEYGSWRKGRSQKGLNHLIHWLIWIPQKVWDGRWLITMKNYLTIKLAPDTSRCGHRCPLYHAAVENAPSPGLPLRRLLRCVQVCTRISCPPSPYLCVCVSCVTTEKGLGINKNKEIRKGRTLE